MISPHQTQHRLVNIVKYESVAQPEWGHGPPRNKLAKIFTDDLYQFSTCRK